MKSPTQPFFEIKEFKDKSSFIYMMERFERNPTGVIIIEGEILTHVLQDPVVKDSFIKYASLATSVICCRCSPTQKSEITEALKNGLKKVVCSIGDGGNDVGMILSANVGIGIEGKEGKQAALAADFSIKNFKTLAPLLLWSGRLSYVRTALLTNFVMHRGLIISVIQFIFSLIFNFTTIQIYNGYLMLGYGTAFTNFPVFSLIFNEDVTWRQVFDYPILYKLLQKSRELSGKKFLIWAWMSIYQGGVIMILSIVLFESSFLEIVTITFTALIMIEILNVLDAIQIAHRVIVLSIIVSLALYGFCLYFLRDMMMLAHVGFTFYLKVAVITVAAWFPIRVFTFLKVTCFPGLLDKVRKEAKEKEKTLKRASEMEERHHISQ